MKNLWDEQEAAACQGELGLRVYSSRLLGRDPSLVLHGGGNTSVKIRERNILGDDEDILYVKGSGWDLATIEAAGFSPVRMTHLLRLAERTSLSDPQMVNELKTHLTRADAPSPSVETILHATLPFKYVDHTHADAVVAVTNTRDGKERIREIYGDSVVIIPYVMPGFDLARLCAERFEREAGEKTLGMVLMNHGIFSFGATARESYERMIDLVSLAERHIEENQAWDLPPLPAPEIKAPDLAEVADLRSELSAAFGKPAVMTSHRDSESMAFASHPDLERISQQGPATPDHIIRTKRLPMLGRNVDRFVQAYRSYFETFSPRAKESKTMLDPAPRVILDRDLGLVTVGRSAKDAAVVADIYRHTMTIIRRSEALGGYRALPSQDLFDMEYWDLEQAKLKKSGHPPIFAGEIALVTGAASGIGMACVESLLSRGAAVAGIDLSPAVETLFDRPDFLGLTCDVTDEADLEDALRQTVYRFGGLDMLVLNAGIFPGGCPIEELGTASWRRVMVVNLDANLALLRLSHPMLKRAPRGGRIVVIGSKNVPAPGPGAAAYSASKAGLNQLARVAALEWGPDHIRVNTLHPNAVFDTGIWTEDVLSARARHYGLTVEEYKTNNVLRVEVKSRDVAELAAEMCGPLFAKTTAAQVPVDGGNDRVI